ncbi:unnamed protein product [Cuscuta epithymum]|uniref:Transposase (putative) gypsy type domain-containing protein n=1 Tax=Cuscuta epithymum TaxID=186058 RepID=A0AAV0C9C7_9ASTE|nr:unnamed protein product [Cuscuta epithymum]
MGILEGHSYLNTAALDLKTTATPSDCQATQLLVEPSAQVVDPDPDDLLSSPPEGCFVVHVLSVELGLRFPLHPFLLEYLKFLGRAPCQLTPNSHYYITGFLSLCRSRGWSLLWTISSCPSIYVKLEQRIELKKCYWQFGSVFV